MKFSFSYYFVLLSVAAFLSSFHLVNLDGANFVQSLLRTNSFPAEAS